VLGKSRKYKVKNLLFIVFEKVLRVDFQVFIVFLKENGGLAKKPAQAAA